MQRELGVAAEEFKTPENKEVHIAAFPAVKYSSKNSIRHWIACETRETLAALGNDAKSQKFTITEEEDGIFKIAFESDLPFGELA